MSQSEKSDKPHWTETLPTGEKAFCFKKRKNRRTEVYRYTLRELAKILNEATEEKETQT